jgi:glycosyltransferase 2 family protein
LPPIETVPSREQSFVRPSLVRIGLVLLRLTLAAIILTYLYRSGVINLRPLAKLLPAWPISIASVVILLVDVYLMAIRTCWMVRPVGLHLPVRKSFQLNLVAAFFTNVIPGAAGGDIARLYYGTKGNRGSRVEVVTAMLLDRGVGLFSMLVIPLLIAPFFISMLRSVPVLRNLLLVDALATAGLLIAFLLCVHNGTLRALLSKEFLRWQRWRNVADRVLSAIGAFQNHGQALLKSLGIALVANLSVIGVMAMAFVALNPAWLSTKMILVVPLGELANCLPLTPGGLGVGEAAFHSLFDMNGLQGGVEALLCWRIWRAMVGLIGLGVYLGGLGRVVFERPGGSESAAEPSALS